MLRLVTVALFVAAATAQSCRNGADDLCGKQSGSCWCNSACVKYNDCCADYEAVCVTMGTPKPTDAPTPVPTSEPASAPGPEGVEVILTNPHCNICTPEDKTMLLANSQIIKRVVELIDGAQVSVDAAQFTFSRREIGEALLRAKARGVAVRLAMNFGQDTAESYATELKQQGLDVRFATGRPATSDSGYSGLQHSKFVVVDGKVVATGSNNWSSTGTSINEENTVVMQGAAYATRVAAFICHFEKIWADDYAGSASCSRDDIVFSPSSAGYKMVRTALRAATESVDVLMHHMTFSSLVKELAQAAERGIKVRVIVNNLDYEEHRGSSYWNRFFAAGGQMRYKVGNFAELYQLMHHKLVIVDKSVLVNGSGNWSGSGFFNNFENFVTYMESAVLAPFNLMFEHLWSRSVVEADLPPTQPPASA
eukprot:TRINITY_DN3555_c0_g1_i1.p1 TRINITY_DN3555_c0_g1~~TRINITY_DN3555_c0_g1_i1.p1  ORF type:complete len:423 (+),score=196.03 TRINITY_DN3555_c0_g1_i1:79-1347(+)